MTTTAQRTALQSIEAGSAHMFTPMRGEPVWFDPTLGRLRTQTYNALRAKGYIEATRNQGRRTYFQLTAAGEQALK